MIHRQAAPVDNFTMVSNATLRDSTLSWEARGLLAYLSSHAIDFEVSRGLLLKAGPSGSDKMRSMIRELVAAGYLITTQPRDGGTGRLQGTDFTLIDPHEGRQTPMSVEPHTVERHAVDPVHKKTKDQEDQHEREEQTSKSKAAATAKPAPPLPAETDLLLLDDDQPPRESGSQQASRIAKTYTDAMPLSNFLAVRALVIKATQAGFAEPALIAALGRLAAERRTVTSGTLAHELGTGRSVPNRHHAGDELAADHAIAQKLFQ